MRIILDECLPKALTRYLLDHEVTTVTKAGWRGVKNGALLKQILAAKFDVLLTADQSIPHQQNLSKYGHLIVIVLMAKSTRESDLIPLMPLVTVRLARAKQGEVITVSPPLES